MPHPKRKAVRYKGLAALMPALASGEHTKDEVQQMLDAVRMGIGLSKRDKALGEVLEQTSEEKDGPRYWSGYRDGMIAGYEGARADYEAGVKLRPVSELAAEAEAEAKKEQAAN
jgi:hypothetical protein